ncbi:glycosyltransferase family 2 protein [Paenibacillus solani]|uniref:glycosyltransferase family 2 protein n=1 Tax=Paenibacillus solani TaxID=1705565 RepID=UPI003D2D2DA4
MSKRIPASAVNKKKRRTSLSPIHNAELPKVSVIIPAMNEAKTIAAVIRQADQVHSESEVIVVANGSTDGTAEIAKTMGARVIHLPFPLGHDVGRSIGAAEARGDILLFTDADIVIKASDLIPFAKAVEDGVDVALNKYLGPTDKHHVHSVILAKHALNIFVSSPELKGASLTTIPHAMSRKAINLIGFDHLAVPPKAQAMAIYNGLKVHGVHYVDVGRRNPRRGRTKGNDPLEALIVGDHLEAVDWLISKSNIRGNRSDLTRNRESVW